MLTFQGQVQISRLHSEKKNGISVSQAQLVPIRFSPCSLFIDACIFLITFGKKVFSTFPACTGTEFQCEEKCILGEKRCDSVHDCFSEIDEDSCGRFYILSLYQTNLLFPGGRWSIHSSANFFWWIDDC